MDQSTQWIGSLPPASIFIGLLLLLLLLL